MPNPPLTPERGPSEIEAPLDVGFAGNAPRSPGGTMRAILRQCRTCAGGPAEAKACRAEPKNAAICELHRFLNAGRQGRTWSGALRAVRRECVSCMGGNRRTVAECTSRKCPLWLYRFGVRPSTAEARGWLIDFGDEEDD